VVQTDVVCVDTTARALEAVVDDGSTEPRTPSRVFKRTPLLRPSLRAADCRWAAWSASGRRSHRSSGGRRSAAGREQQGRVLRRGVRGREVSSGERTGCSSWRGALRLRATGGDSRGRTTLTDTVKGDYQLRAPGGVVCTLRRTWSRGTTSYGRAGALSATGACGWGRLGE
jgi:hypothetical protein